MQYISAQQQSFYLLVLLLKFNLNIEQELYGTVWHLNHKILFVDAESASTLKFPRKLRKKHMAKEISTSLGSILRFKPDWLKF